jgi:glutamine---fructose-6-phosphate transaminase (isomerizing)
MLTKEEPSVTKETLPPGRLMAAELAEQPAVLGRLVARHAADREQVRAVLPRAHAGTVLLARGSSDNVAVYGRYLIEMASRRPAGLAAPSVHTRYRADVDYAGYLVVALSQSGATPEVVETAASMRRAGAVVIGIANEPGSPLTQVCNLSLLTEAGPELAVPATKTVTAQMLAVAAIAAAYDSSLVAEADLAALPDAVASLLTDAGPAGPLSPAEAVAERWAQARRLVVTGRGLAYAAALETALKIKETAQVHAEGLSSADLLHGPIAALDSRLPVLVVSGGERFAADETALTARLSAEGVPFAVCGSAPNAGLPLPAGISEITTPILATVRGQQFALASSLRRGLNPDAPAGLSKVTETH